MTNNSLNPELPVIKFSKNWNNKLYCDSFTTIRKMDKRYIHGNHYNIMLNEIIIKEVKLIDVTHIRPKLQSHTIFRIDTGLSKEESLEILTKFYGELPEEMFILCFHTIQKFPENILKFMEIDTEKIYKLLNPKK